MIRITKFSKDGTKIRLQAWLVIILVFFSGSATAEPLKLRVGWVVVPAEIIPIISRLPQPNILHHYGKSYAIEPMRFQGSSMYTTALASGDLDIAPFAFSSFTLAVENAGMKDLRVILGEDRDGFAGYYTNHYMVKKDGPIKKIEDLKGRVLAIPPIGSLGYMDVLLMMHKHGLNDADVSFLETAMPNRNAMLAQGKVDLISSAPPFYFEPSLQSSARTLFTGFDARGPAEIGLMAARQGFLKSHPSVVIDFLEDYLRALRWYEDPANRTAALKVISEFTKVPAERFASWVFTKQDNYRDPDGLIDVAILQKNIDVQYELGFLKNKINAKPYVDMSFIEEAAKRAK